MYTKCLLLACFTATLVCARSTSSTNQNSIDPNSGSSAGSSRSSEDVSTSSSYMGDIRFLYKIYQECSATELSPCLKMKLITAMDRAARTYPSVSILDGVTFVKDPNSAEQKPIKSEADLEATLPRSLSEREDTLNGLIVERIVDFFQTHTLQMKLPTATEIERSFSGEARKRNKKMNSLVLLPLIIGGTLIPLALGALALLAGKALIVSKLALVLAAIIGIRRLISGAALTNDVELVSQTHSGHTAAWGRAYSEEDAQNLAYRAHAQPNQ